MSALSTILATLIPMDRANAHLKANNLPVMEDHEKSLNLVITSSGARTQADVARLVINLTEGHVNSKDLTEILKVAFPKDKVGERHGPNYLSLARTGKLKTDFSPDKRAPSAKSSEVEALKAKIAKALEAKTIKEMRAALE